jgi:hypothetical protein
MGKLTFTYSYNLKYYFIIVFKLVILFSIPSSKKESLISIFLKCFNKHCLIGNNYDVFTLLYQLTICFFFNWL